MLISLIPSFQYSNLLLSTFSLQRKAEKFPAACVDKFCAQSRSRALEFLRTFIIQKKKGKKNQSAIFIPIAKNNKTFAVNLEYYR